MIQITNKTRDGWHVATKYESDELALRSRRRKAPQKKLVRLLVINAGRKTRQTISAGRR